jgi:ribosomal protein S18 acetylase RimI-like enzyme
MTHPITLADLAPGEFRAAAGRLVAVYAAAMRPAQRMLAGRELIMERHSANPGFRALAAFCPGQPGDAGMPGEPERGGSRRRAAQLSAPLPDSVQASGLVLAGFIYGFHGHPGQWWHDTVATALRSLYPLTATTWLADSFEVAELHVLPAYQGRGIGRRLLLELTGGRPERTAVLSTQDAESRARQLYRSVGFSDLLTAFYFSGGDSPYAVMGAMLPLRTDDTGREAPGTEIAADGSPPPRSARPSNW